MLDEQNVATEPLPGHSWCSLLSAASSPHFSQDAPVSGQSPPGPYTPQRPSHPTGVETLWFQPGATAAGLGLAPLPWEGGNWSRPGSATHSSLFLRWLNVCLQIPEACVTPHLCPRWSLAWLAVASFLPLLGQAGLQGGVPGQVSLVPAAHQLGPEP